MSFAQCDKNVMITSSKTEYLDANDSVQHTEMESTVINISKSEITITPGEKEERKMHGKINSFTCNWSKPFKEGKSVIKAVFVNRSGETKNATITIEGKGGTVVFLLEAEENEEIRVKVIAEKFEERK